MNDKTDRPLSERVRDSEFETIPPEEMECGYMTWGTDNNSLADEIAALEKRLAEATQKNLELARHNMELRDRIAGLEQELKVVRSLNPGAEAIYKAITHADVVNAASIRIAELESLLQAGIAVQQMKRIAELERELAEATKFIQDIADGGGFTGAAAKDFLESTHD